MWKSTKATVPGEFCLTQSKLCLRSAGRRSAIMGIMAEDNVSTIFESIPQQIPPLSMGTRGEGNNAAAMEAYQEDRVLIAKVWHAVEELADVLNQFY